MLDDSGRVPPALSSLSQKSLWDASPFGVAGRGFYAMSTAGQGVNHSGGFMALLDISEGGHRLVAQFVTVDAYAREASF